MTSAVDINFNKKRFKFISAHNAQTNPRKSQWATADSSDRSVMPWLRYTDFIGAHSPFNTVHKWARGGLIEWVCGFLLTLQGPLHPTPARKQIKLQFHHLEGTVSCPNAALSTPPCLYFPHIHTRTQNSTPPPHQRRSAPPPPKCQPLSTAQLPRGMEGFEGRKRERGGWVLRKAKGIGSMHGDLIAASSQWNILLWRKRREKERQKGYTAVASR